MDEVDGLALRPLTWTLLKIILRDLSLMNTKNKSITYIIIRLNLGV